MTPSRSAQTGRSSCRLSTRPMQCTGWADGTSNHPGHPGAGSGRGAPDLFPLSGCDTQLCVTTTTGAPGDDKVIDEDFPLGTYFFVVDSAAGNEGAYGLSVDCW